MYSSSRSIYYLHVEKKPTGWAKVTGWAQNCWHVDHSSNTQTGRRHPYEPRQKVQAGKAAVDNRDVRTDPDRRVCVGRVPSFCCCPWWERRLEYFRYPSLFNAEEFLLRQLKADRLSPSYFWSKLSWAIWEGRDSEWKWKGMRPSWRLHADLPAWSGAG